MKRLWVGLSLALALLMIAHTAAQIGGRQWPAVTHETKPWTRWWWHGSAVERASLTANLQELQRVGIGGVEITPIYGVRGAEAQFIPYLSDQWLGMLQHTLREARRLGLGVDMATGTGWPFGGPWVDDDMAPRSVAHKMWTLEEGQRITDPIRLRQEPFVRAIGSRNPTLVEPLSANKDLQALAIEQVKFPRDLPLAAIVAKSDAAETIDLTDRVGADRMLNWTAPRGRWTVYALFAGWHGKLVERAAPGGEGYVIDHFSPTAIRRYLAPFDRAFAKHPPAGLRAFFNDSYEVDDAAGQGDWTPLLFDEFQKRRGYDLRAHLPALLGRDTEERNTRVLIDYRETISDLLLDAFTREWGAWARRRGAVIRNQAHGSPANLLDLYAASDIPETEGTDLARFKWATSAAHVAGRRLVSAEAATWLGEHFRSTLADVRTAVDHFFIAGVNHIVYHGTAYSPVNDPWPGWQFYAAVEFNSRNAWWDDFVALNRYVTRVQSFMQSGRPDQDVLLYFPFQDAVAVRGKALLAHFGGASTPTAADGFEAVSSTLQARGYAYDYISDRQLRATRVVKGRLIPSGGSVYRALVVPPCRYVPRETLDRIAALEKQGARVLKIKDWRDGSTGSLETQLSDAGIAREPIVDRGVQFARRADATGRFYFLNNRTDRVVDGWLPLGIGSAAMVFDPMDGRRGTAETRGGGTRTEVYLHLDPGASLIVAEGRSAGTRFDFFEPAGQPQEIGSRWEVRFVKGGPTLPSTRTIDRLASWTTFGGDDVKSFSGTAVYSTIFPLPSPDVQTWKLDLGRVHESARVRLNERDLATLIGPRYVLTLRRQDFETANLLEISVTNLSANRMADLDRRGVLWKKFYNVNYPPRLPQNRGPDGLFTAAKWDPLDSGLIGPVTLTPVRPATGR